MGKKWNEYEPLTDKQFSGRFSTSATYPERSFCRPRAPGPIGPFLPPMTGSLPLLSSLLHKSTPHEHKRSVARSLQTDSDLPRWPQSALGGGSHLQTHPASAPPSSIINPAPRVPVYGGLDTSPAPARPAPALPVRLQKSCSIGRAEPLVSPLLRTPPY